jgi:hypothetical protein
MSHGDNPLAFTDAADDWLDRRPAVIALKGLLAQERLATPLVVGVYGGWGTGKTSVMRTLESELAGPERLILWFDAWVYARQEQSLWRALLLRVIEALRRSLGDLGLDGAKLQAAEKELEEARTSLYRSLTVQEKGGVKVNRWGALPLAADAALTALTAGLSKQVAEAATGKEGTGGIVSALAGWLTGDKAQEAVKLIEREASERYVEQVGSLEQFKAAFERLLAHFEIGPRRRLFVFVDDLDRCLPEDAVAALEAIKLFLDLPGCVFVLGMDRTVVEQGIRIRYQQLAATEAGFDPRSYLDKVIQIPFALPPLGEAQITTYLHRLTEAHQAARVCIDLVRASAVPANPRTLKRILNLLELTLVLDGLDDAYVDRAVNADGQERRRMRYLAKLVLLQVCFDNDYREIAEGRRTLKDAEAAAEGTRATDTKGFATDERLKALLRAEPRFAALPDEDIARLLSLSKITAG